MRALLITFTLASLLASPLATASSHVDGVVLVVIVEDDRGDSCNLRAGPTCQASATLDPLHPGNTSIDTYQRIEYLGVATNGHGLVPLPNESVTTNGQNISIPAPFLRTARDTYNENAPDLSGVTNASLVLNESGSYAHYYGPAAYDPTGPSADHYLGMDYATEQGVHNDSIGPANAPSNGADTHHYADDVPKLVCEFDHDDPACLAQAGALVSAYDNTTPDVKYGIAWFELQAATDPNGLTPPGQSEAASRGTVNSTRHDAPPRESGWDPSNDSRPPQGSAPPDGDDGASGPKKNASTTTHPQGITSTIVPVPIEPHNLALILKVTTVGLLFLLTVLAGYSRFASQTDVLQQPKRRAILDAIIAQPGINTLQLARLLSVDHRTIRHHAAILVRWHHVITLREGGDVRYYVANARPEDHPSRARRILNTILDAVTNAPDGAPRERIHALLSDVPERTRNNAIRHVIQTGEILEERTSDGRRILRANPTRSASAA